MSKSIHIPDLTNIDKLKVSVEGTEPSRQIVCFGKHRVPLADFFRAAEFVLLAGDLGDDTDPRRIFQSNISELQIGEGRFIGAKRFRPSHERLMAGTTTPHG